MTPYDFAQQLHRYGVKEIPGKPENPLIRAMHYSVGYMANEDEPWCGSFMGLCHKVTAYEVPKSATSARAWLNAGEEVPLALARPGDVVVLWRGSKTGWMGHVAFYVSHNKAAGTITLLGGNQGDQLSIAKFDLDKLLGIRGPKPIAITALNALKPAAVLINPTTA